MPDASIFSHEYRRASSLSDLLNRGLLLLKKRVKGIPGAQDVKDQGEMCKLLAAMLSTLGLPEFRATALQCGISAERFERLADEISSWTDNEDSIAAFAECTVVGWKP